MLCIFLQRSFSLISIILLYIYTIIITHDVSILHSRNVGCDSTSDLRIYLYNFKRDTQNYDAFRKWPARSFGLVTFDLNL